MQKQYEKINAIQLQEIIEQIDSEATSLKEMIHNYLRRKYRKDIMVNQQDIKDKYLALKDVVDQLSTYINKYPKGDNLYYDNWFQWIINDLKSKTLLVDINEPINKDYFESVFAINSYIKYWQNQYQKLNKKA